MNIYAYIYSDRFEGGELALSALDNNFDRYSEILMSTLIAASDASNYLEGRITLVHEGAAIDFEDDFTAVMQNFCFRSIPSLLQGEVVLVPAFSYPGALVLVPENDFVSVYDLLEEVVIFSNFSIENRTPRMTLPRAPFIRELLELGELFVDIWERLSERYSQFPGLQQEVKQFTVLLNEARGSINDPSASLHKESNKPPTYPL